MGRIVIDQKKVTPEVIKELQKLCPFNAFEVQNGELIINSGCRVCKICVRKGPNEVCTFVEDEDVVKIDKSLWNGVAVFIEHDGNRIHPVSFELIGKARELADKIKHPVYAVLMQGEDQDFADEILEYGVDKVFIYNHKDLNHFNVERYTNVMEDFINKIKPTAILYGGTSLGRSFAPRVASRFKTGLTADCTMLDMKENTDLVQIRPAFGGNVMAQIVCPNRRPQMATVRYKIFKMPEKIKPFGEKVIMETGHLNLKSGITLIDVQKKDSHIDISEADVIVALGRIFKTEDDIKMAQELADALGGVIGVTRPLIEAGLADSKTQIGLSGRTVAPKLLIALGVSGAVQFTAGVTGSETIIAVNTDPNAPIFDIAHYGIVGDAFSIIPELIKKIKAQGGGV
ncbi:MAG TPA: electron transfer flavoprotein subunit alpha/FixB family protein [Acholeplasmataceae bacterium]|jgi:electron transfer flavoprotein alpha subunit|nr:electron transfer flavoprotein subunit alpha/FixB family protein [Acholeplasmataceae bacterium]